MQVTTAVIGSKVKVYVKGQQMKLKQHQVSQAFKSIGQSTEIGNSNRTLAQHIAYRHSNYNQDNWTFDKISQILLNSGSQIKDGDRFVPTSEVYPHFHIGKNFITLSLAYKTIHIDVINAKRTAGQFFQQVDIAEINSSDNGKVIKKLIGQLRQLAKPEVKVIEIDKNGNEVDISNRQFKECAIM